MGPLSFGAEDPVARRRGATLVGAGSVSSNDRDKLQWPSSRMLRAAMRDSARPFASRASKSELMRLKETGRQ